MRSKKLTLLLCSFLISLLFISPGQSAIQEYAFEDQELEQRFRTLIAELRCPMCINSNLAGSDAPIAANLRAEIYDQVLAGQSDEEIIDFLVVRYGDFINYRPPLNSSTFLLWFGPGILLCAGFFVVLRMMKNSQTLSSNDSLSEEEDKKLKELLASDTEK